MIDNYTLNDEGELVLDDSAIKSQAKWKKIAIISLILCICLVLLIVLIILLFSKSDEHNNKKNKVDEKGEILCTYNIDSINILTPIISSDFDDENFHCEIEIDNNIFPFSKYIKFNNTGYQKVKYIIYGDINMKNMFKGIKSLLMVEMNTNNNIKINSIENPLKSCTNFFSFKRIKSFT